MVSTMLQRHRAVRKVLGQPNSNGQRAVAGAAGGMHMQMAGALALDFGVEVPTKGQWPQQNQGQQGQQAANQVQQQPQVLIF